MNELEEFKIVIGIMRTSNVLVADLKDTLKPYDINTTEFSIMEFLYHKGEQTIQQIRERTLIASGSATYVVDNLEKKGYVVRKIFAEDKRICFVDLTDAGKNLIKTIFPIHSEKTKKLFKDFDEQQLNELRKLLLKIKN